ncbi:hypothetical protein [Sphingopyxis fribergensis]
MNDPAKLFAVLVRQLEDMHGLAIEGQCPDQSPEMLQILSGHICNGLQRSKAVIDQIRVTLGPI